MKKYYVTVMKGGDEFVQLKTDDQSEAIERARTEEYYNKMFKEKCNVEIRVYKNDIEDENCTDFDYDIVDF